MRRNRWSPIRAASAARTRYLSPSAVLSAADTDGDYSIYERSGGTVTYVLPWALFDRSAVSIDGSRLFVTSIKPLVPADDQPAQLRLTHAVSGITGVEEMPFASVRVGECREEIGRVPTGDLLYDSPLAASQQLFGLAKK